MVRLIKLEKFNNWYKKLDMAQKTLVDVRLIRVLIDSHFGAHKKLGNIFELKFKSGLCIYYAFDGKNLVLLLNGGGKNTKKYQNRDIEQAKKVYREYLDGK